MKKNTAKLVGCSFLVMLSCAMFFGCAPKHTAEGLSDTLATQESEADYVVAANDPRARKVLVRKAESALGTPYVLGGTAPGGFDCSGLVQWTFNHLGVALPRTAREQSQVGRAVRNVNDMQAGDIVAFRHPRRGYHTGIYVGDGKFIHSPRKRTRVQVGSLADPYFSQTFLGARRVVVASKGNAVAEEAQTLVAENIDAAEMQSDVTAVAARSEERKSKKDSSSRKQTEGKAKKGKKGDQPKSKEKKRSSEVGERTQTKKATATVAVKPVRAKAKTQTRVVAQSGR